MKAQEDEDSGAAVALLAIAAGAGVWAWLRSRKAQPAPVGPAFTLVERDQDPGQRQPGITILPRGDFMRRQTPYSDRSHFGFAF